MWESCASSRRVPRGRACAAVARRGPRGGARRGPRGGARRRPDEPPADEQRGDRTEGHPGHGAEGCGPQQHGGATDDQPTRPGGQAQPGERAPVAVSLEDAELGAGDGERGGGDRDGGGGEPAVEVQQDGRHGGERQAEGTQSHGRADRGAHHLGGDARVVPVLGHMARGRRLDPEGEHVDDEHDAHQGRDHRVAVRAEPPGRQQRERVGRDVHRGHADGDEHSPSSRLRTCCRPRHACQGTARGRTRRQLG